MAEITVTGAWTQVGSGPMCVQALTGRLYILFSATAPLAGDRGLIPAGVQYLYPADGAIVWARSQSVDETATMVWMACAAQGSGSGSGSSGGSGAAGGSAFDFSDSANSHLLAALAA